MLIQARNVQNHEFADELLEGHEHEEEEEGCADAVLFLVDQVIAGEILENRWWVEGKLGNDFAVEGYAKEADYEGGEHSSEKLSNMMIL